MLMRLQTPHLFLFRLVEETDDLTRDMLATALLVVHDTGGGGEDHVSELTGGQELDDPLLEIAEADVVAGRDDTGLVEAITLHKHFCRFWQSGKNLTGR